MPLSFSVPRRGLVRLPPSPWVPNVVCLGPLPCRLRCRPVRGPASGRCLLLFCCPWPSGVLPFSSPLLFPAGEEKSARLVPRASPPQGAALLAALLRAPRPASRGPATDFFPVDSPKIVNRALTSPRGRGIFALRGSFHSFGGRLWVSTDGKMRRLVFDQAAHFSCPLQRARRPVLLDTRAARTRLTAQNLCYFVAFSRPK